MLIALHGFEPEQRRRLQDTLPGWQVRFAKADELKTEEIKRAEIICGWSSKIAEAALAEDSALRWVQGWSAGVDYMPLEALQRRGVLLTTGSGVHPNPMSETAFALMLAMTRGVHLAVRNQQDRRWDKPRGLGELHGATIGIVGAGTIGREIARLARAFGMRVLGLRRSGVADEHYDRMYAPEGLDELLGSCDYVVNVLPATPRTRGLFDEGRFAAMKRGAIFVNIGRGATVKTESLLAALRSGALGGAGLDVFEREPLPEDHPLWTMPQVVITPHLGGETASYNDRIVALFMDNLALYLEGRGASMANLVDYEASY
ncbi:D-2-hydroxyacid dehydrogenase [Paenibacillus sp. IB182496]|uniref:D-2-hydroxyacid dehydrogenase n=1 Tax=Paenibacillus sabuli TaxID=2772509 RepID=A0A927GR04_9BACL|nr:D-2-hydroxyacid dehydrogenase [Paenibacillus sabuli]MBD2844923.1 D-2-hydroxyacid dehydrogenase [Paenibacillus sabuli]